MNNLSSAIIYLVAGLLLGYLIQYLIKKNKNRK